MPIRPSVIRPRVPIAVLSSLVIGAAMISPALGQLIPAGSEPEAAFATTAADEPVDHVVVSELQTGGAGASDEFVELYNPTASPLTLDGIELVYVSASGATVTRKATWSAAAEPMAPGSHLLVANAAGVYAGIADLTYANGMAAAGGSVALRLVADGSPVDAVGWGTAAAWFEGAPAVAPAAGESLERLPGGSLGSGQDTDDNVADFVVNGVPDPQNSGSPPITTSSPSPTASASATALPTPTPTPTPTSSATATPSPSPSPTVTPSASPSPSPTPTPTPSASPISIAEARALPDGSEARIAGTALMSSGFADGGACVADATAGIAVLSETATIARGDLVDAIGLVDDRYAQRTLRVSDGDLQVLGSGPDPDAEPVETGAVGETVECRLVALSGEIQTAPTVLASGLAFEVDDGSGPARVLVATAAGIDTGAWARGVRISVVGVVGQRDSSGTGSAGYRVQPRDPGDVLSVVAPSPTPSPSPSGTPEPTASASPSPPAELATIADARAAETGSIVRVRGVVTLPNGLVDAPTAVIQDASGAIVLRMGDGAGTVVRGTRVEVVGRRSTKSGMLTIRTDTPPAVLGTSGEPDPRRITTGGAHEAIEARLVIASGEVVSAPSRSTAGNAAFSLDDGTGPIRVTLFAAADLPDALLQKGDRVEVIGVLGQVTTGAQPNRGYYLWPRGVADLRVVAQASSSGGAATARPSVTDPGTKVGEDRASPGRPASPPAPPMLVADRPWLGGGSVTGGSPGTATPAGTAALGSAPPAAGTVLLASARLSTSGLAVLLLGVALCVSFGVLAWRSGALLRLALATRGALLSEEGPGEEEPGEA